MPAQEIRFCTSEDGVRIAWATSGEGPVLVKTANWLNHVELDWESPVWRPWLAELSRGRRLVRYDARGNGLSDWNVPELSLDAFVRDLEAVVEAARLERYALIGMSQGCAVAVVHAVRHPERVSRLVLYGGFARGWRARGKPHEIADCRGHLDACAPRVGHRAAQVPAALHVPLLSRGHRRADGCVQRAAA